MAGKGGVGRLVTALSGDLVTGGCGQVALPLRRGTTRLRLVPVGDGLAPGSPPFDVTPDGAMAALWWSLDQLGEKIDEIARLRDHPALRLV
jgi:hypothetical protein